MKTIPLYLDQITDIDEWRQDTYIYPAPKCSLDASFLDILNITLSEIYPLFPPVHKNIYRLAVNYLYMECYSLIIRILITEKIKKRKLSISRDLSDPMHTLYETEGAQYPFELFTPKKAATGRKTVRDTAREIRDFLKFRIASNHLNAPVFMYGWNSTTLRLNEKKYQGQALKIPASLLSQSFDSGKNQARCSDFYSISLSAAEKLWNNFSNEIIPKKYEKLFLSVFSEAYDAFLNKCRNDLTNVIKFFTQLKISSNSTLLVGAGGYETRIVSEAFRTLGGFVTATPHGGGLLGAKFHHLRWLEFMTCDEYICLGEKEPEEYKTEYLPGINNVRFTVMSSLEPSLLDVRSYDYSKFDFSKIKNITHIPIGFRSRYFRYMPTDLQIFGLELDIIDYFLKFDKKYTYKCRPKSEGVEGKNFNLFGYYGNKIQFSYKPVIDVIDETDLFICENLGSYALWEVLTLSDKPVILFLPPMPEPLKDFDSTIGKRCFVVKTEENPETGKITFDQSRLNGFINNK